MNQRVYRKFDLSLLVACGDLDCFDRMQENPATMAVCVECYRRHMGLESSEKPTPPGLLPQMVAPEA